MNSRHFFILLAILAVLIFGVFIKETHRPAELATELFTPLDLSFELDQVTAIELGKAGQEALVKLVREDSVWRIPELWNARADAQKAEKFLTSLRDARGELRVTDPSLFPDFGIEDSQAFRAVLKSIQGETLRTALFGTKDAGYGSVFVRPAGSNSVYLAEEDLLSLIGIYGDLETAQPKADFWTDLELFPVSGKEITAIDILRFDKKKETLAASLVRDADGETPGEWKFTREGVSGEIDPDKIGDFLGALGRWRAQKVLDPKAADYGFDSPTWVFRVKTRDGREVAATRGKQEESTKDYFVRVSTEAVVYEVSAHYFEELDVDDSHFLKAPSAPAPPQEVFG